MVAAPKSFPWRSLLMLLVAAILLLLGANYTVQAIKEVSAMLNVGTAIVAVTVLAVGTSLPELIVTVSLVRKGNPDMAVGNVLGSNIFNSLAVMGIPGALSWGLKQTSGLIIPREIIVDSLPAMIVGTLLLFFVTQDKEVTPWEGWLFLIIYGWFISHLFGLT